MALLRRAGAGAASPQLDLRRVDWPTRFVALALVLLLLAIQVWDPPLLESARLRMFDQFQRWAPREASAEPRVAIVDIDDHSLNEIGQWPWPRSVFAELIDALGRQGAGTVAFDVLFAEPDRLSPPLYAAQLDALSPTAAAALRRMPNNEFLMAEAMRRLPVVLGEGATNAPQRRSWQASSPPARVAWLGAEEPAVLPTIAHRIPALATLSASARGLGLVAVGPEVDGVVRRAPSAMKVGDVVLPGLGLEALRVAAGQDTLILDTDSAGVRRVLLAGIEIPTDRDGRIWLRYSPIERQRVIPAVDVLTGAPSTAAVRGKIVLVGASAAGLGDIKVTPIDGNMPGAMVHAQLIENLLDGSALRRPPEAILAERAAVGVLGGALAWWGVLLPAGMFPPLLAAVVVLGGTVSWLAYQQAGLLLDATYPMLALGVVLFWLAMAKYIREEGRRRSVRRAFGHYLSPVMVDRVVANPRALSLAGERRELTILFSDIRDFTTLTEQLGHDPERMTDLLNHYFTAMTDIVLAHGGTIDKYIGDAVMAFWNAPLDDPAHARNGALAALQMLRQLDAVNAHIGADFAARGLPFTPLRIGVGLESGVCYVGNLGSAQRFNYSTIGDPVNAAARIESLSKEYGFPILLGEAVRFAAPRLACLEIDNRQLRGKSRAGAVFALLGDHELVERPAWPLLMEEHARLRATLAEGVPSAAELSLERCIELTAELGVQALYAGFAERSRSLLRALSERQEHAAEFIQPLRASASAA